MKLRLWTPRGRDGFSSEPAPLRELLDDARFAPLWLVPRLAVGWLWLEMGWSRLGGFPSPQGGLAGGGRGMSDVIAFALTLLGIALLLGGLTGIVAFAGGCLSAGMWGGESLGIAAVHFAAVIWLILAWKTAGWIGLDRWLLPALGMSWRGSALFAGSNDWLKLERSVQGERNDVA